MAWDWERLKGQQERQRQQERGPMPPLVEEVLTRFRNMRFRGGWIVVLLAAALFVGISCYYTVKQDEVGVVQRFGRYVRTRGPGLKFKLPAGIEKVTKVNILHVRTEEFQTPMQGGVGSRSRALQDAETENVTLMLTGDLNVAVVPWIVQYRIKEPYKYLFKVANVGSTLRDLSESTMRLVVGDRSINEVISKREEIADEAMVLLQKELDEAETGIGIVTIELKKTNVPGPVQSSFNEVNQAVQEKEKTIYQAREDYNKAVPAAKGEAERVIKAAEGYALDRVNRAKGDAARFVAQYEEYAKAKDVTRRRIYLEALKDVLPNLGKKYVVDADQKNLLPFLNLGQGGEVPK
ncbi:FtsH protease activity modulator HflK [Thermodesulfobacteriota bacterium]